MPSIISVYFTVSFLLLLVLVSLFASHSSRFPLISFFIDHYYLSLSLPSSPAAIFGRMLSTPREMFYSQQGITNLYNSTNRRTHALTRSQSRSSIFDVGPVIIIAITNVTIKNTSNLGEKKKPRLHFSDILEKTWRGAFEKGGGGMQRDLVTINWYSLVKNYWNLIQSAAGFKNAKLQPG